MMKRVLEVNVDDQNFGGVFALVKNVIANNKSDTVIDIAAIEPFDDPGNISMLNDLGCKVHFIGFSGSKLKKQFAVYKNLKKLLQNEHYDCVHIHADTANKLLVSGLASKHSGAGRIILHSHSSGIDGKHRKWKLIFHKLCRRALKSIGTDYVSCSDLAAKWMFPNISEDMIVRINNGIKLEKFRFNSEKREHIRRELGIKEELLIGHVGRFNYQKNHEYLIRIMKTVNDRGINARLLLVGAGENEQSVRSMTDELGLHDKVIFYGVSDKVHELMQAMDIFVLPSHFEGQPVVGVEAQAAGLPVVFSDKITRSAKLLDCVRFCPITDSSLGQWADNIIELTNQTYDRLSAYMQMKEQGFSIEDTVNSFLALYIK